MARSDIVTQIPLDVAAQILGVDPYHYNTIVTTRHPEKPSEDDIWFQYAYQHIGQAARDDLALALYQAEQLVMQYLGYSLVPMWTEDEPITISKPYNPVHRNFTGRNSRLQRKSVETLYKWIIEAGVKTKTLIDDAAAIVYSDADGDGYAELATVTVSTTVTEPQEIHAYFPGEDGEDNWEIRPIDVLINTTTGVATITFKKYQVPDPELWIQSPSADDPVWRTIDGDVIGNFITTVDVYRVYNDPSDSAVLYNEDTCGACGGTGCTVCGFTTKTACLRVRDARLGLFSYQPATYDADEEEWTFLDPDCCSDADKIIINYRHGKVSDKPGVKYPYWRMSPTWERAIVHYAYSILDRAGARTENTHNTWNFLTEDRSIIQPDRSFVLSGREINCPLGKSKAALNLWAMIQQNRIV